jgi:hypothetical protein
MAALWLYGMKYFLILFCFFISKNVEASCHEISSQAQQLISKHIDSVKGGEYCKYREVYKQENIELILYTIEGACYKNSSPAGSCGNHFSRYMVGIVNGKKYSPVLVGGKVFFLSKEVEYFDNTITISGHFYKKHDPACCPSIPGNRKFNVGLLGFELIKP